MPIDAPGVQFPAVPASFRFSFCRFSSSLPNPVKKHVQNLLPKLGVETRLAALLAVERLGLPDVNVRCLPGD